MKKLLITLYALSFAATAFAQTEHSSSSEMKTSINPIVGFNVSMLTDEPSNFTSKSSIGWHIGGNVRIGSKVFLQPGLQLAQFSSQLSRDDINPFNDDSLGTTLTMLRIPILAGLSFVDDPEKDAFNFNIHGGVAVEMVLGTSGQLKTEDINQSLFSVVLGAGVDLHSVTIDVDYELGLSKLYNSSGRFDSDTKNNALLISLGWRIPL